MLYRADQTLRVALASWAFDMESDAFWGDARKPIFIKPLQGNNGKSPYECVNGRPAPLRSMFFLVFGAPCQWKPLESPKNVNDPRTVDGYYLGKEGHFSSAVLIYCLERELHNQKLVS